MFAIGSAALFAIRPIFVKLVYVEGVDSTTLIAFRMLFSVPIYIVLLLFFLRDPELRSRLNLRNIMASAGVGIFGYYFASFLDLLGLQYLTAQLARMILYIYPTFVVLIGAVVYKEAITPRIIFSLLLTYLGVAVIFGHDLDQFGPDVITGAMFIVGSALAFSIYLVMSKPLISDIGSRLFTCIALISASIGILTHYSLTRSISAPEVNQTALLLILVIAIFCTVLPTFFTTAAVARIGANNTGIVAMIGPGFTSVFAVLILSEAFTVYHLGGIALTVIGVAFLQKRGT